LFPPADPVLIVSYSNIQNKESTAANITVLIDLELLNYLQILRKADRYLLVRNSTVTHSSMLGLVQGKWEKWQHCLL
jgi:hypothetical protein